MPTPREVLDRLDVRHDELIRKLDELNADIERALREFTKSRTAPPRELPDREAASNNSELRRAA